MSIKLGFYNSEARFQPLEFEHGQKVRPSLWNHWILWVYTLYLDSNPSSRKIQTQGRRGRGWWDTRAAKYNFQIFSLLSVDGLHHEHYQCNATFSHKASMGCQHLPSWSQEEHGETNNLRHPPKPKDSPTRWLVQRVHHPTTTAEQFWRSDEGMPLFYCCHIPPHWFLSNQLNIASIKAQLRWPWVSVRNWV